MKVFQIWYRKTHTWLHFFGVKFKNIKHPPAYWKLPVRKNVSQKKKKKQINIIFTLKASTLDLRSQQINIFKVLQEKNFESRFLYSAKLLNMEKK